MSVEDVICIVIFVIFFIIFILWIVLDRAKSKQKAYYKPCPRCGNLVDGASYQCQYCGVPLFEQPVMPPDPYTGLQGQDAVTAAQPAQDVAAPTQPAQDASALCDQCSSYAVKINPDGSGKCLLCGYFYNYYDTGEESYQSETGGYDPASAYPPPAQQEAEDFYLPPPPKSPSLEQPPPPQLIVTEPEPVEEVLVEEEIDEGKVNVRIIKTVEAEDATETSYCNECGAQVESGWNVCIHCGSKLI